MTKTQQIVKMFEDEGKSPYYIIGHLQAILISIERDPDSAEQIISSSINHAKQLIQMNKQEQSKLQS